MSASELRLDHTASDTSTIDSQDVEANPPIDVGDKHIVLRDLRFEGWRGFVVKLFMSITHIVFMIFIFGMPFWSKMFEGPNYFARHCWLPAEHIWCGSGQNYTQLVFDLGLHHRIRDGKVYGCGCGEGVLGDWVCSTYFADSNTVPDNIPFSISYFISSAPGTGAMAAFSAFPILSMWIYGFSDPSVLAKVNPSKIVGRDLNGVQVADDTLWFTQVLFQLFFGLFLIHTECVNLYFHQVSVNMFILAMLVHYVAIIYKCGMHTRHAQIICLLAVIGLTAELSGYTAKTVEPMSWWGQYGFFLGECIGLSCAFGIAPVLAVLFH